LRVPEASHRTSNPASRTSNPLQGKLSKDLSHLAVNFSHPKRDVIDIELHHGARKNVATLRTVRTLINNLIIGVTKGFKYKMRYVYAHFPINVNLDKNNETGLWEVEIRYVEPKLECGNGGSGRRNRAGNY
jgi:large subunit ribosomal protein L9e